MTASSSTSPPPPPRILVVGAGLSGCVAAWCLRQTLGEEEAATIEVWDGARGCGGRLATQRVATQGGEEVRMNMGASRLHYAPTTKTESLQERLMDCLEKAGVIQILPHSNSKGGVLLPLGASNEVCRWMLTNARAQTKFQSRIRSIDFDASKQQFAVSTFGGGGGGKGRNQRGKTNNHKNNKNSTGKSADYFDAVVFAGSPAEVRTTYGEMQALTKPMWRRVRKIQHTRNCCLGLAFRDAAIARHILEVFQEHPVLSVKDEQGVIEELVLQPNDMAHHIINGEPQSKPETTATQNNEDAIAVLVAKSTEKFGETQCQHLRATHRPTPEDLEHQRLVTERLVQRVCRVLAKAFDTKGMSFEQLQKAIVAKKLNYWKYAQIQMQQSNNGSHKQHACCFVADCSAPFVVVGDYFPGSHQAQPNTSGKDKACGFTAVVQSGEEAAKEVASRLNLI